MNKKHGFSTDWQELCEHDWLNTVYWCLCRSCSFFVSVDLQFNTYKKREEVIMARRKDVKDESESLGEWNGIANVVINDNHKARVIEILSSGDFAWENDIADLVASDYKFVIRWDDRSDCPYLSVSCYAKTDPNFKFSLVSRAPSWRACFALFWVKHFEVCSGVWSASGEKDVWG